MVDYVVPGVYRQDIFTPPEPPFLTGVPAFLGYGGQGPVNEPQRLTLWPQFETLFGPPPAGGYLAYAVRGFFENEGRVCYVVRLDDGANDPATALSQGLARLEIIDSIDLVCAPDTMGGMPSDPDKAQLELVQRMQAAILDHCDRLNDRLAILDSLPNAAVDRVRRQGQELSGTNGALYYPWIDVGEKDKVKNNILYLPPCGHVAGAYARSDQRAGVHKAPANDVLEGVLDLEVNLTDAQQGRLNPEGDKGVNCLRVFPGRGIRIWGARTLSRDPAWRYVSVRRLFLTAGRWIERTMAGVVFEPHNFMLWLRIERELRAYFNDLFRQGALKGRSEEEAFYVKCDAETNPPEVREAGLVVTEIGLAPAIPNEFVVVRLIHGSGGVTMVGPSRPV